jgi:hypothetical protein
MLTCVNAIPMNRRLVIPLRGPNSRFTKFRPDLLSLTWRKVDDADRKTKIGDGKLLRIFFTLCTCRGLISYTVE